MLRLNKVKKVFNPGTVNQNIALQEVDLRLEKGEFVTVIGSNGAGKSTLLDVIAGSYQINKGEVIIAGRDVTDKADHKRANLVSRVFQDPLQGTAASMTIAENLALALKRTGKLSLSKGVTSQDEKSLKKS